LDPGIFLLVVQLVVSRDAVWLDNFWQWMGAYMAKRILSNHLNVENESLEITGQQRRTCGNSKANAEASFYM